MTPRFNEEIEDTRDSPSQPFTILVPTREATPEQQHATGSFHLSQDFSKLLRPSESNELLLSALSRGDAFGEPEEFTFTVDQPSSFPDLIVTLCEDEPRQESVDRNDRSNVSHGSRLMLDTSGETERGQSFLGSALSGGSHVIALSPSSFGGSVIEESSEPHRKRKGKERAPDSDEDQEQPESHSQKAHGSDGDHDYDLSDDSDNSETDSGADLDALPMGEPGPSKRSSRRAGMRNHEDLSALMENYGTSLEEQQRALKHFSALKHSKPQQERPATKKRRRQYDSDDDEDNDSTFQPSPGAQQTSHNFRAKRVKRGIGSAGAKVNLSDVDNDSTRRRPNRKATARLDDDAPSDTSRPDPKKQNEGSSRDPDLDYTHKKRKRGASTSAPNKKLRTERKGFQCTECLIVISRKSDLNRHYRTAHTGLRVPCTVCHEVFSRVDAVGRHLRDVHGLADGNAAQRTGGGADDDEDEEPEEEVRKVRKPRRQSKKGGKRK